VEGEWGKTVGGVPGRKSIFPATPSAMALDKWKANHEYK